MDYYLDSEILILEVEKYPHLYDPKHNGFKNREMKKDAWMAVTKNVIGGKWDKMDDKTRSNAGKEVQKRWKHMKDSFLKSIRNDVGKSGDARKTKRPYIYHKQMMFLQAVSGQRETLGNMTEDEGVVNNDASEAPIARANEPYIAARVSSRMPKKRKTDPFEREVLKVLQANVGQDPDEMFLISQLPYIKKMKENDKFQFQIQFLQLIQQCVREY